jgi:hypothetical protein
MSYSDIVPELVTGRTQAILILVLSVVEVSTEGILIIPGTSMVVTDKIGE